MSTKAEANQKLDAAMSAAKDQVNKVQTKLQEFDETYEATATIKKQQEKATDYMSSSINEAKQSLEAVSESATSLFNQSKENAALTFASAVAKFKEAVDAVEARAKEYDNKYQISAKISEIITPIKDKIAQLVKEFLSIVKSLSDGLNARIEASLKATKEYLLSSAASLDNKYDIENKVTAQLDKIGEAAKTLDSKFKLQELLEKAYEKGKEIDGKVTNGKAGTFVEGKVSEGFTFVTGEVEKLYKDFDSAKRGARESLYQDEAQVAAN